MAPALRGGFGRGILAVALIASIPVACRQIIHIPDGAVVVDPSLPEEDGGASPLCRQYCEAVQRNCTGKNTMYPSLEACLGVCALLPAGKQGEPSGNSVQCRYLYALSREDTDCQSAGPIGNGTCGDACEVYCDIIAEVCQEQFLLFGERDDCIKQCRAIPYTGIYSAENEPHEDSLGCRIYHLSAATLNPKRHCLHAIGVEYCPDTDGGLSAGGGSASGGGAGGSSAAGGGE